MFESIKGQGEKHLESTMEEMFTKEASSFTTTSKGPPKPPMGGVLGFFAAFGKEIRKDLGV